MLLEGIFPAATTPFYPDGRLYLKKLEHNVERFSLTPVAGIVILGSTGEAVMLGDEETRQVLRTAREAAAPEKVLIAGVARESVAETLRLAEYAADQQYDAVLVRTPGFYAPNMGSTEMLTYYRAVADRSPLPVIIYSIPKFTHYEIPIEVVAELAQHPNIIGIKDSSSSVQRIAALVTATRSAQLRELLVTPTFDAFTSRMLLAMSMPTGNFVSAESLGGSGRYSCRPAARASESYAQEASRLSGTLRRGQPTVRLLERGSERRNPRARRLRSAGLPGNLHRLEGQ